MTGVVLGTIVNRGSALFIYMGRWVDKNWDIGQFNKKGWNMSPQRGFSQFCGETARRYRVQLLTAFKQPHVGGHSKYKGRSYFLIG